MEAERSVLGAVLLDPEMAGELFTRLSAEDFSEERHSLVWRACLLLDSRSTVIDLVTVTDELERQKWLERVGGMEYVASLTADIPILSNVLHYAEIVREKSMLRRLLAASSENVGDVVEGSLSARDIIDRAEKRIFEIGETLVSKDFVAISELVRHGITELENLGAAGSYVTGLSTGFEKLDRLTTGLHGGELVIIAARPSVGKTTLALNMAEQIASSGKGAVGFFSLEMSDRQLAMRLLCSNAGIGITSVAQGTLPPRMWQEFVHAADRLSRLPLFIDDSSPLNSIELRAKARHLKKRHGLCALFVDYLQLMRGIGSEENRQVEIARISGDLKSLSKDLDVPVIALSQLSRRAVAHDGPPRLSDLRESGAIEQDADLVLFIHDSRADEGASEDDSGGAREVKIVIGKQRNGPRGELDLLFEVSRGRFVTRYSD
jgi:replicative DNA helicase